MPEEAVYDRLPFAHTLNLFDINRSYGDVVPVKEVLGYLDTVAA